MMCWSRLAHMSALHPVQVWGVMLCYLDKGNVFPLTWVLQQLPNGYTQICAISGGGTYLNRTEQPEDALRCLGNGLGIQHNCQIPALPSIPHPPTPRNMLCSPSSHPETCPPTSSLPSTFTMWSWSLQQPCTIDICKYFSVIWSLALSGDLWINMHMTHRNNINYHRWGWNKTFAVA